MDAALLSPTFSCGYSSLASLLAEYTEAPASLTITYCSFLPRLSVSYFFIKSAIIFSDSLEAVPFPTDMISISYSKAPVPEHGRFCVYVLLFICLLRSGSPVIDVSCVSYPVLFMPSAVRIRNLPSCSPTRECSCTSCRMFRPLRSRRRSLSRGRSLRP